jgi:hypothetical protein
MMDSDEAYFARRAEGERAAARRATDPSAEAAHLELAQAYERAAARATAIASHIEGVIPIRPQRA